jgi:uncharacterized phage protein gp47/JayE
MRTISQVLDSMRESLEGGPLSNFSPYSNIYALYRAVAIVIAEQDSIMEGLLSGFHLGTAMGAELDRRALDYGISRLGGVGAKGWVLVRSSQGAMLHAGTLLTDPTARYQYEVLQSTYIGVSVEVPVYVTSTSGSSTSNLPAGTYLTSSFYPSMTFLVGRYRDTSNGRPVSGISGGTDRESDTHLRDRLLQHLRNRSSSNRDSIYLAVRAIPGITKVILIEHEPIAGYFTVYVDTSDSILLGRVRSVIGKVKAAGISYLVKPITSIPVNVEVYVSGSGYSPDAITTAIEVLISELPPSTPLLVSSIREVVGSVVGVSSITNITPSVNVPAPPMGQVLVPGTIRIHGG